MAPRGIHDDALHQYLFNNTDSQQRLKLNQYELGNALGVDQSTVGRALQRLEAGGKIKIASRLNHRQKVYWVADPAEDTAPAREMGLRSGKGPRQVAWQ